jgi:hypothetical protein
MEVLGSRVNWWRDYQIGPDEVSVALDRVIIEERMNLERPPGLGGSLND